MIKIQSLRLTKLAKIIALFIVAILFSSCEIVIGQEYTNPFSSSNASQISSSMKASDTYAPVSKTSFAQDVVPGQPATAYDFGSTIEETAAIAGYQTGCQSCNEQGTTSCDACAVQSSCSPAAFAEPTNLPIRLDTPYTFGMLDFQNRQGDKEVFLLEQSRRNGGQRGLTFGAQFRASAFYARTNTADKFNYLGRFPTDFAGSKASDFRLLHANQNITANFTPGIHGYFETLFSDVFSFGDFKQGSFQVRQAYVVFGDFNRSPYYAFIGKKNISFGSMKTLSPFSQSMPWHYFAPLAEGGGVGIKTDRVNATLTALNGSRGIRVVDSQEKGDLNNFAANVLVTTPLDNAGSHFDIGAGYLHGTIYNAAVAEHLDATLFGPNNGAFDINALLRLGRWQLAGEYVQTIDPWPATGREVIAYSTEAAYDTSLMSLPARASISWSEGIQGDPGTEFEFNRQLVLGYQVQTSANARFTFEYVRGTGFAPLIAIQQVSDIDVKQNSFVFGAVISL